MEEMTVLQPVKSSKKHPQKPAGAFILSVSATCLLLGLALGVSITKMNSAPKSTYWQEKAANVKTEIAVRYPKPETHYTSPEAIALKAEMDALRRNFERYRSVKAGERAEIFARPKVAEAPVQERPERLSTGQLVGKITRTLLIDEADSFLNKVQMMNEVREHVKEVGF